jgi:hypothetical protein
MLQKKKVLESFACLSITGNWKKCFKRMDVSFLRCFTLMPNVSKSPNVPPVLLRTSYAIFS